MSSQHPPTTALEIVRDEQRRNAHDPAIVSLLERIANRIENETAPAGEPEPLPARAKPVDPGTPLEDAVNELFSAHYRYREFIKRHYRDRLAGVMWLRRGDELVAYSECLRYTQQVCQLTHSAVGDSFSLIETPGED